MSGNESAAVSAYLSGLQERICSGLEAADGSARFEVAKRRSRRFSVQLGAVEVLVTGTQFRVARTAVAGGDRVRVDVEEGSVEVHRKGAGVVLLEAGDLLLDVFMGFLALYLVDEVGLGTGPAALAVTVATRAVRQLIDRFGKSWDQH